MLHGLIGLVDRYNGQEVWCEGCAEVYPPNESKLLPQSPKSGASHASSRPWHSMPPANKARRLTVRKGRQQGAPAASASNELQPATKATGGKRGRSASPSAHRGAAAEGAARRSKSQDVPAPKQSNAARKQPCSATDPPKQSSAASHPPKRAAKGAASSGAGSTSLIPTGASLPTSDALLLDFAASSKAPAPFSVAAAAGGAAAEVAAAVNQQTATEMELEQLGAGVHTRAARERLEEEMRPMRKRLERELREQLLLRREKEEGLLALLSDPLEAWDEDAFWQLAMCEFAIRYDPEAVERDGGRKMGTAFRAAAIWALRRDKDERVELPRLKGVYELHALHAALLSSDRLRIELTKQLMRFKRLYCAMLSPFGRFKRLTPMPGETLLHIFERTHMAARGWRPRGNPGKEPSVLEVPQSKVNGIYTPEWIQESLEAYHTGAGKTLSLRGTVKVSKLFARRYLKNVPEQERPKQECCETLRLRDIQNHRAQRLKALENSFSRYIIAVQVSHCASDRMCSSRRRLRLCSSPLLSLFFSPLTELNELSCPAALCCLCCCSLQWDEVQINKVAWSVIIITSQRPDGTREREVIKMAKLKPDGEGMSKTGVNVGGTAFSSLVEFGAPLANVQLCCSDSTSYNSSLTIASTRHKGGAYAHMWTKMRCASARQPLACMRLAFTSHLPNLIRRSRFPLASP
jgi:hypothetical protein